MLWHSLASRVACLALFTLALVNTGCVPTKVSDGSKLKSLGGAKKTTPPPAAQVTSASIFSTTLRPLIQANCAACHGTLQVPFFGSADLNTAHDILISQVLVSLAAPATSRLVIKIQGGHSGIDPALATQIQTQIQSWSTLLAATPSPPPPPPAPGGAASIAAFTATLHPILQTNCASCHAAIQTPMFAPALASASHDVILNAALVSLAVPANSRFVVKIQLGHSGINPAVATTIQNQIQAWATQATTSMALPAIPVLEPKFGSIHNKIFVPKCVACHGSTIAKGDIRYDSYAAPMRTVVAGDSAASALHESVDRGGMPEGLPRLTDEEIRAIRDWIDDGAPEN